MSDDKHRGGGMPGVEAMLLPAPGSNTGQLSAIARDYVAAVRGQLEEDHWAGAGGVDSARRFSAAVDNLVRFIVDSGTERFTRRYTRAHQRCAIIAQGGYGRCEMNPWSDVDLLVFYSGRITPYIETINELLIQTLFDAGLQVGWAVRTSRECLDLSTDLTIKTTLLDGRFLCGTPDLGAEFTEAVQDVLTQHDSGRFVEAKLAESRKRRSQAGGSVFMLEPDVKEGMGGLRDLHSLLWTARVLKGVLGCEDLKAAGVMSGNELKELLAAAEFIHRVRNGLHFITRQKQDKLSFDRQDLLAERFGYQGADQQKAVDLFMREYYSHAAILARTSMDAIERLVAPPEPRGLVSRFGSRTLRPGVTVAGGQLVADEKIFRRDAVNLLRVFGDAQRLDLALSSTTREAIRNNAGLLDEATAASDQAVEAFFQILGARSGVYRSLAEMNRLGVLGYLIPEFGRLFCMVQRDFYHVYTVDEHSLVGVRELELLRGGAYLQESPVLTQIMRECPHADLIFLSMMFHDLGKGYGGDHDEKGALMVRAVAARLQISEEDTRALEFLVRHHLLMSSLAQNRDIEDPELIADFAKRVGSLKDLKNLYLLTFADMSAVGPGIWNGWKEHLLSEFYLRTADVFEKGEMSGSVDFERKVKRMKVRIAAGASAAAEKDRLEAFLASLPDSYFLASRDEEVISHWRLYESLGSGLFRSGVEHFTDQGFSEMTFCGSDQPGLFAGVSGVLAAHGLNIASARIVTSSAGIVMDTYRVDHATADADPLSAEVWDAIRRSGELALRGKLDVGNLVSASLDGRRVSSSVAGARRRARIHVDVDNEVSSECSVIDVYAADRPGLLFSLASTLAELGLKIHRAKISTYVSQALDVFYVTDQQDRKVTEVARVEAIKEAILELISQEDRVPEPSPASVALP